MDVEQLMSTDVATGRRMSAAQIRRMPVIDDQGHPVGLVSLNDLARASSQKSGVTAGEVAATLAAISAPRHGWLATGAGPHPQSSTGSAGCGGGTTSTRWNVVRSATRRADVCTCQRKSNAGGGLSTPVVVGRGK
jgi:hypothetical protein